MTELSRVLVELSDARAVAYSDAAVETIGDEKSPELVRVLEHRAYLHITAGESRAAIETSDRALAVARDLGLPESSRALVQRGIGALR